MQVESGKVNLVAEAKGFYDRMMHSLPEFLEASDVQNIPQRLQASMHDAETVKRAKAAAHHQRILDRGREGSGGADVNDTPVVGAPGCDTGADELQDTPACVARSEKGSESVHREGLETHDVRAGGGSGKGKGNKLAGECSKGLWEPEIKPSDDGEPQGNGKHGSK